MSAHRIAAPLLLLLLTASAAYAQADDGCACTMEWNPQCDPVTGITYGSPSCAHCAGEEVEKRTTPGACPDKVTDPDPGCVCTKEYNPQCDPTTGITYSNPCTAKCSDAQDRITEGACPEKQVVGTVGASEPCICFELYQPVCGKDGKTYTNSCFAACANLTAADTTPGACTPKSEIDLCEEDCPKEGQEEICAIFITRKPASLRKKGGGKGKQVTKTVTFASGCIAACNGVTKADATYWGACNAAADKACAADVCRDHATCVEGVDLGGEPGFVEVPSTCYANKLFAGNGTAIKGQETACIGKAAKAVLESIPCLKPPMVRCFADPCQVSSCSVEGALCVSNYCDRLYRGTILSGGCTAVFLDPATGNVINSEKC